MDSRKTRAKESLRENFKPEFLNRLDETVIFHPISRQMLEKILELQLGQLEKRLEEKKISLLFSDAAKNYLTERGFDPAYGARPLKRVIQNEIMDELALLIIEGKIKEGGKVKVDVKSGKIVLRAS